MTAIRLYLDEDSMSHSLAAALRSRGVDLLTALEVVLISVPDEDHLSFASAQGRVIYSHNVRDFYRLHSEFLQRGLSHAGIVLSHQQQFSVGERMRRLMKVRATLSAEDMLNRVEFLGAWA